MKKPSYAGKTVFIGIDVHRKRSALCCVCDGDMVFRTTVSSEPEDIRDLILRSFAGAEICTVYEAGFSGFVLHRTLERAGIRTIVINPASVEINARDRVKTDRKDALQLAMQLSQGRLRGIRIPSEDEERRRLVTRTRAQLVRQRARVMNQIRSKLHQLGQLSPSDSGVLTQKRVREVLASLKPDETELLLVTEALLAVWDQFTLQIRRLEKQLRVQASTDPCERIYRSLPGIGHTVARVLSNELGDMSQFSNERKLYSFTGLTPSEFSSGEQIRRGHISRQGSARLRHVLTEAAWIAIQKDPGLRSDFDRIAQRAGAKRAIVAIARKLLGRARALFRKGEVYRYEEETLAA